jgi:hypothetical protein
MLRMDDIAKSLNLDPIEDAVYVPTNSPRNVAVSKNVKPVGEEELANDFDYARGNFYNVIERGTEALDDMLEVARQSQHPRAYEVVSTLMKTLADANKDLIEVSTKKNEDKDAEDKGPEVVNNNLFVGSTADLQKMLKDMDNGGD